jgi:hypothetical protein
MELNKKTEGLEFLHLENFKEKNHEKLIYENDNLKDTHTTSFGSIEYKTGIHYFEVKILETTFPSNIMIGNIIPNNRCY